MIINKHETGPDASPAVIESPADKTLRLAAAIGNVNRDDPLRPLALDVLSELLRQPNPPVERLKDAGFIARLLAIEPGNRTFRRPDSRLYGGAEAVTKEQEKVMLQGPTQRSALNRDEQNAAIAASQAAYKQAIETGEIVLPVDETGPVAPPLQDAETLIALVRQPGAIGAAAIHDALHPGSHN